MLRAALVLLGTTWWRQIKMGAPSTTDSWQHGGPLWYIARWYISFVHALSMTFLPSYPLGRQHPPCRIDSPWSESTGQPGSWSASWTASTMSGHQDQNVAVRWKPRNCIWHSFHEANELIYFELKRDAVYWIVCQVKTRNEAFTNVCILFFTFPKNIYGVSVIRFALRKTAHVDTSFSPDTDERKPMEGQDFVEDKCFNKTTLCMSDTWKEIQLKIKKKYSKLLLFHSTDRPTIACNQTSGSRFK